MGWVALFSTHPKHEAHHELHHRSDDDRNALCKLRLRVAMYLFAHLHLRRELQLRRELHLWRELQLRRELHLWRRLQVRRRLRLCVTALSDGCR